MLCGFACATNLFQRVRQQKSHLRDFRRVGILRQKEFRLRDDFRVFVHARQRADHLVNDLSLVELRVFKLEQTTEILRRLAKLTLQIIRVRYLRLRLQHQPLIIIKPVQLQSQRSRHHRVKLRECHLGRTHLAIEQTLSQINFCRAGIIRIAIQILCEHLLSAGMMLIFLRHQSHLQHRRAVHDLWSIRFQYHHKRFFSSFKILFLLHAPRPFKHRFQIRLFGRTHLCGGLLDDVGGDQIIRSIAKSRIDFARRRYRSNLVRFRIRSRIARGRKSSRIMRPAFRWLFGVSFRLIRE